MALAPLELRKFEFSTEADASDACAALNKIKYVSTALGSAVLTQCRPTKKLEKALAKYAFDEVGLSDYDRDQINSVIKS